MRSLLLVALAGCGGGAAAPDAEPPPDAAPPADLSCAGAALPTVGTDPIVISGRAYSATPLGQTDLPGALAEAFQIGGGAALYRDTSDAAGVYTLTIANPAMTPLDGYLVGTAASYLDTYLYPPAPLAVAPDEAPLLFVTSGTLGQLAFTSGVVQSPALGFFGVRVDDCAGNPIPDATVTVSPISTDPPTTVVYVTNNNFPDPAATATHGNGLAFVFNVPTGAITVDAELDGTSLREHVVTSIADAVTTTAVAP